jgi:ActR/RegA family two-component response regulator
VLRSSEDSRNLLLIDPDRLFSLAVTKLFRAHGWNVELAEQVDARSAQLWKGCSWVAILDMGVAVSCRDQLQAFTTGGSTFKYHLVDSRPSCQSAFLAGQLGASSYFAKPIDPSLVFGVVSNAGGMVQTATFTDIDSVIRAHVETTLRACGGNVTRAAQVLGIRRQSLQRKLRKLDLNSGRGRVDV